MAVWYIEDLNPTRPDLIRITDTVREWYIPKFALDMVVEEPYLHLYWSNPQTGTGGLRRSLPPIDYRDVADGYGGYVDNPASATALMADIEAMIISGFGGGGGDILTAKADLLSHDGVSDTILPGGANEYFLQRDNTESTGLKWVPGSTAVAAGLTAQNSIDQTGATIQLENDAASPGNYKAYGTDSAGTRGYQSPILRYQMFHYGTSYADTTPVFFGGSAFLPLTANVRRLEWVPQQAIRITKAYIRWMSATVAGSNENLSLYVRKNDATDYLIATIGSTDASKEFYNASMNAGAGIDCNGTTDGVCIKVVPPAWVTNPTNTHCQGYLEYILL